MDFETVYGYIENIRQSIPISKSLRLNFEEEDKRKTLKPEPPTENKFPKNLNEKLVVIPIKVKS